MNDEELTKQHLNDINKIARSIKREATLMEICGGHTNIIMKYGIREILPKNIRLISGPGCPVCVSSQKDIDCMIELAMQGVPVATYGDMMRVPGSNYSLEDARAKGCKVFEVYSAEEVLKLRKDYPHIVFFGIGFETTAPMTTFLLENNICVYSVHKLVVPAIKAMLGGEIKIDGFINPGHVSTIIGEKAYADIKVAQAITGFSAERILRGIRALLELIKDDKKSVVNAYPEAVHYEGNIIAQKLLNNHFKISDSEWRGLGVIPNSGLEVRKDDLNAKIKYKNILSKVPEPKKTACRCGEVLKGLIEPTECPLYRKACTPENPKGACMVSEEGSCSISYKYGR
ncbi:hydrogenase formation protein HypD [Candidatus Woesearchaeota archaeon]|nr:hydrogenase formation protein HypD [Candidatus Woesearchaeota archaeon]